MPEISHVQPLADPSAAIGILKRIIDQRVANSEAPSPQAFQVSLYRGARMSAHTVQAVRLARPPLRLRSPSGHRRIIARDRDETAGRPI